MAIPATLATLLGGSLWISLHRLLQDLKRVEVAQDQAMMTLEMNLALERQIKAFRGYLYSGYPQLKREAAEKGQILVDLSNRAREISTDQRDRDRFRHPSEIAVEIDDYTQQIVDRYAAEGNTPAVFDLWNEAFRVVRTAEFGDLTQDIENESIVLLDDKKALLQRNIALNQAIAALSTLALVLLAIVLLRAITKNLTDRLEVLEARISNIVNRLLSVAEHQDTIVSQQVQAVDYTAVAVRQLEVSARTNEGMPTSLLTQSQSMSGLVSEGTDCVRRNFEETHRLRDWVVGITDRNRHLSDCSQSISSIVGLVGMLARQTNMLALNAAVEAARAGDRGQGFAIIAAEIRALADRSRQSSEEIADLVNTIQGAAVAITHAIDGSDRAATNSVAVAEQTRDVLHTMDLALDQSANEIHAIAQTIREQALAVQQIADAMSQLSEAANEINLATDTVQTTVSELAGVTRELGSIV